MPGLVGEVQRLRAVKRRAHAIRPPALQGNPLSFAGPLFIFLLYFVSIPCKEEQMLKQFGDAYAEYRGGC